LVIVSRSFYLMVIIFIMGLSLVVTGLYALIAFTGIPMPGPAFIFIVTIAPGLYLFYLGARSLRKMQQGVDPWY
jgi:hypothetical protein